MSKLQSLIDQLKEAQNRNLILEYEYEPANSYTKAIHNITFNPSTPISTITKLKNHIETHYRMVCITTEYSPRLYTLAIIE